MQLYHYTLRIFESDYSIQNVSKYLLNSFLKSKAIRVSNIVKDLNSTYRAVQRMYFIPQTNLCIDTLNIYLKYIDMSLSTFFKHVDEFIKLKAIAAFIDDNDYVIFLNEMAYKEHCKTFTYHYYSMLLKMRRKYGLHDYEPGIIQVDKEISRFPSHLFSSFREQKLSIA